MKSVLLVVFGSNRYNDRTKTMLESNHCKVMKYNVFKDTRVQEFNLSEFDCLILGGGKKTISIYKLLNLPKNASNNPLYETYNIIKHFKNKPILSYGYGCLVLGLYYKCAIKPLDEVNKNDKQHIIVDHRYRITKSTIDPSKIKVTFNNKNMLVTPSHNPTDAIMFRAKNKFEPCGFRFDTTHYGFLFRLIDSEYGKRLLLNFMNL